MPSAQRKENEELLAATRHRAQADFYSLVREIRASKNGHLNALHRRGTVLFAEGEPARGVYILQTGRATVSISSIEGRIVTLRLAQSGDVLGLNSVLRNCSYDTTLKTLEPCRIDFISRAELIELIQQNSTVSHAVLEILSRELSELTDRTKLLLLSQTVKGRLAKLLLEWTTASGPDTLNSERLERVYTHEEIAHLICSSRESVSRLLATLNRQQVIRVQSDSILIQDRLALEKIATT